MNEKPQDAMRDNTQEAAITRIYRDAATETPPPAIDAAVLRQARAASATRASRWSWGGWQARFAVLATVVISFTLLLFSQQPGQDAPGMNAIRELREPAKAEAAPGGPAARHGVSPQQRAPDTAARSAPVESAQDAMSKIVVPAPVESGPAGPAPSPALAQPAPPAAPAADKPSPPQRMPEAERRVRDGVAVPAARAGAAANSAIERAAPLRAPDEWIARIRELRKQGQMAEAARELDALRKRHPELQLPQDLLAP